MKPYRIQTPSQIAAEALRQTQQPRKMTETMILTRQKAEPTINELINWGRERWREWDNMMGTSTTLVPMPLCGIYGEGDGAVIAYDRGKTRPLIGAMMRENHALLLNEWCREHGAQQPAEPAPPPPETEPERIGPKYRIGETVVAGSRLSDPKELAIAAVAVCPNTGTTLYGVPDRHMGIPTLKEATNLAWYYEANLIPLREHLAAEAARHEKEAAALRERLAEIDQEGPRPT